MWIEIDHWTVTVVDKRANSYYPSPDEGLVIEPPARHWYQGLQLRGGGEEKSLSLTRRQQGHEGMLCNTLCHLCCLWTGMRAAAGRKERTERGRRDRQRAGRTDTKRAALVSSAQRLNPPPPPPLEPRTGSAPFTHRTEVSPTSPRCSFSTPVGRTVFFFFFFSLISASYCKPWRPESRGEKGGTLLHAFRQPS